ncbi:LOW QUALITY PROTEIN: methenyltetrahydrofolate synthase domain-containing protein [Discoglossus pictus]
MEPAIRLSPGCSKEDIRQKVWDYMEKNNLADFPRPVHHRIPNFKGATQACQKLPSLQEFKEAKTIKINPDTPQKSARFLTLEVSALSLSVQGSRQACQRIKDLEVFTRTQEVKVDPDKPLEGVRLAALQANKTLLVPTPRLRTGLFNKITPPPAASKEVLRVCSTSQGVKDFSVPMGLEAKVHVDLVVVGSVAVSEQGWRIGKGEGFADMEYAMMVAMGAVTERTIVVTIVHDCQVIDFSEELLGDHDLTVDYILTPTRVIKTDCKRAKPQGIIWSKISHETLSKIPILRKLLDIERRAGKDVSLKNNGESVSGGDVGKPRSLVSGRRVRASNKEEYIPQDTTQEVAAVYIGNIPSSTRVSELKSMLRERGATPLRLTWQGAQHRAFLDYRDRSQAEKVLCSLDGLNINGHSLKVELARTPRQNKQANESSES